MIKFILDAAKENIFLTIITNKDVYNISHENSKTNYDKLIVLINNFLNSKGLKINDISSIYVNRGPGSFAGIRNSLTLVKAIHLAFKIEYYCYSLKDFKEIDDLKNANIPNLCVKFKVKKNLIKPLYLS